MEPTPIFAALVAPPARGTAHGGDGDGDGEQRRTVPDILRALRAEQIAGPVSGPVYGPVSVPPVARGRVGHVPELLSFAPAGRG